MACKACNGSGRLAQIKGDKLDVSPCPACRQDEIRQDEKRAARSSFAAWKREHGLEGVTHVNAKQGGD